MTSSVGSKSCLGGEIDSTGGWIRCEQEAGGERRGNSPGSGLSARTVVCHSFPETGKQEHGGGGVEESTGGVS